MWRFVVAMVLSASLAAAAEPAAPIRLANRVVAPAPGIEPTLRERLATTTSPVHGIVQLQRLPSTADRARLAAQGIRLSTYLGQTAYYAAFRAPAALAESDPLVRWAGPLLAMDKIEPELWRGQPQPWAKAAANAVRILVAFHNDAPPSQAEEVRLAYGGPWRYMVNHDAWATELDAGALLRLAAEEAVRWIEQGPRPEMPLAPAQ